MKRLFWREEDWDALPCNPTVAVEVAAAATTTTITAFNPSGVVRVKGEALLHDFVIT